ncbi:unnamed protein product [Moneuplotes crassus]|uniref:Uncharacterized protein n=1 Tax=Euplotes crassus TaxID=5936 RepID=A0AAD1XAR6_EUPCR|nr:unnamed protein product [Moneuplotes crassus]
MNSSLIPLAVVVIILNAFCLIAIGILARNYWKIKIREFYFRAIILFLVIAYLVRISAMIYVFFGPEKNWEYNSQSDKVVPLGRNWLIYGPIVLHTFSIFTYSCRWTSFCIMTTAQISIREKRIKTQQCLVKVAYISVISLCFIIYVVYPFTIKSKLNILPGFMIALNLICPLLLLFVANYFLCILKNNERFLYKQKATPIRIYTSLIAFWLLVRCSGLALDFYVQMMGLDHKDPSYTLINVNDYVWLTCYFTELFPSISIMIVLWKSFKEMQIILAKKENKIQTKTESDGSLVKRDNADETALLQKQLLKTKPTSDFIDEEEKGSIKHSSFLSYSLFGDEEKETISRDV